MYDYLETCEKAARTGGSILSQMLGRARIWEKGHNDLVTEADLASQQAIRDVLLSRFPGHEFVGEETPGALELLSADQGDDPPFRWIVDPLDGTMNFAHGMPGYAVSVALERGGEVLAGVVYDPRSDECFRAAANRGAEFNGSRLRTSGCRQLSDALMAVSFAAQVSPRSLEVRRFVEIVQLCQSIRRLGSAALNLCYVAAGRLDGYVASSVKAWDVAAGALIVREAGGAVTGLAGDRFDLRRPELVCAATSELQTELLELVRRLDAE